MSTPVEPLHCILLGLFIRLIQRFNHLRRLRKENSTNQGDPYLVFTSVYKDVVECDLKTIGFLLKQQSDPDMPCTYFPGPSSYLPDASNKNYNSTGKKMAHELRGVLLVLLIFMLTEKH